jgi:hypothetical protein
MASSSDYITHRLLREILAELVTIRQIAQEEHDNNEVERAFPDYSQGM